MFNAMCKMLHFYVLHKTKLFIYAKQTLVYLIFSIFELHLSLRQTFVETEQNKQNRQAERNNEGIVFKEMFSTNSSLFTLHSTKLMQICKSNHHLLGIIE